jgi:integrase/recombinase XerD
MLEKYIKKPHVISRMQRSNINNILDDYVNYLDENGYSINSIQPYLRSVEHFTQWLTTSDIQVDKQVVEKFLKEHLPICKCQKPILHDLKTQRAALYQLLRMLKKWDPHSDIQVSKEIGASLNEFDHYLKDIHGLTESTRYYHRRYIREFLVEVFNVQPLIFNELKPQEIIDYIDKRARFLKKGSTRCLISSLRSYFNFLKFNGENNDSLIRALPRMPNWKLSTIPDYLHKAEVEKFLDSFDHTTGIGKRDYAAARCLIDLGLRCCEVANLQLDI